MSITGCGIFTILLFIIMMFYILYSDSDTSAKQSFIIYPTNILESKQLEEQKLQIVKN